MGFMALVFHRRLPRVVFRAAAISSSKWACVNPPVEHGRHFQSKSAKNPARLRDENQSKLVHWVSPAAYKITTNDSETNEHVMEENHDFSFDDMHVGVSKPRTKPYSTRSSPEDKQIETVLGCQNPAWLVFKYTSEVPKNQLKDEREDYDVRQYNRVFQQYRPEYKSICYNSERPMETPTEECDRILQNVTSSLTPREVSEFLEKLSCLPEEKLMAIRSDDRFLKLCRCSTENLRFFTNSEIIHILGAFVRLGIANCPMLKEYKKEICARADDFSTDELLLVADTLRCMDVGSLGFLIAMYRLMEQRCVYLTLPQLIELVYIIGGARHAPMELMEKIEQMLLRYIRSMTLEEIGQVCLGFFKTQNKLSPHLREQISSIVEKNLKDISNFALVNVLKMCRFSRAFDREFFHKVGREASKRVSKMPVQGIMHIILAFASMRNLHTGLMNAVALTMVDRLSYCRTKDLAKILWSFAVVGYQPSNADAFFSVFIEHIKNRRNEFLEYPEHFLTCLMALIFYQQFPLDLIQFAMSKQFTLHSSKVKLFELKKDLYTVAASVAIECPQYTGETISWKFQKEVSDLIVKLSTREIHTKNEWIEAGNLLRHILGGPQYVKEHMILPHTRSKDFEVHLDANRKPIAINTVVQGLDSDVQLPKTFKITDDLLWQLTNKSTLMPPNSKSSGVNDPENPSTVGDVSMATCSEERHKIPAGQSEITRLAIQVTNRNQYLSNSFMRLMPLQALKRRQLQKLGYVVVEVPHWEWLTLSERSQTEKIAYLHQKVFSSLS